EGERPPAYIVILGDTSLGSTFNLDKGIAAQTILLGAAEKNLGGCFIATVEREKLAPLLDIGKEYEITFVLPIGKPKETVVLEEIKGGDVKYWRDEDGVHHVPKRPLNEIIL
ncbi:MAG: nitroreductase family protein, partial [Nitrospinota bacterium]